MGYQGKSLKVKVTAKRDALLQWRHRFRWYGVKAHLLGRKTRPI